MGVVNIYTLLLGFYRCYTTGTGLADCQEWPASLQVVERRHITNENYSCLEALSREFT